MELNDKNVIHLTNSDTVLVTAVITYNVTVMATWIINHF